jgi:hypothetical protein
MTNSEWKILFKAFGFLAVILGNTPPDKQAMRATALAKLFENFCMTAVADDLVMQPANADQAAAISTLFSNLIHNNENNKNLVKDAMAALQHCLNADALHEPSMTTSVCADQTA